VLVWAVAATLEALSEPLPEPEPDDGADPPLLVRQARARLAQWWPALA